MKKILLLALAALVATSASAEGYQVNSISAKQLGMAHTGVAQKLNSESVWFNPAAAAYQDQKFTIAGSFTGVSAFVTYKNDGATAESDNKLSTPISINANYKINDDLAVGVVFNTPYGSSMNWGDNWVGMHEVQNISLSAYNFQPTVSYKLFDDKLSVGAGLMISWGSFELSKSMVDQATTAAYGTCNATLSGDAAVAYGVNVGLMYDISDKWSIGASYRSEMKMAVNEGKTSLDFDSDLVKASFLDMERYDFTAELPMPSTFSVGATCYPTENWTISAEVQMVGWSTYESLEFAWSEEAEFAWSDEPKSTAQKDYENTTIYRLGAQYDASDLLTARVGIYYDQSPVQDEYFTPETPSMDKLGYTCGVSLRPCSNLSVDLAYAYLVPASYDRTSSYSGLPGTYRAVANIFSVGLAWGF